MCVCVSGQVPMRVFESGGCWLTLSTGSDRQSDAYMEKRRCNAFPLCWAAGTPLSNAGVCECVVCICGVLGGLVVRMSMKCLVLVVESILAQALVFILIFL